MSALPFVLALALGSSLPMASAGSLLGEVIHVAQSSAQDACLDAGGGMGCQVISEADVCAAALPAFRQADCSLDRWCRETLDGGNRDVCDFIESVIGPL